MVNGIEHYCKEIERFDKRISQGERLTRVERMNYHTARREVYFYMAREAKEMGDIQGYEAYDSKAQECNGALMALELGNSRMIKRRLCRRLDDFAEIKRKFGLRLRETEALIGVSS